MISLNKKLLDLLKLDAKEIDLSFEKASIEGRGTPQEVADRREASFVKIFLEKYFPFPYRIAKGNIVDSYELHSNSIDCIVLNPSHPYTIDPKNDKASIIFADGVDFAIEVKPKLADQNEIERALIQIQSVKALRRRRNGVIFKDQISLEEYNNTFRIPGIIFSNDTFKDINYLLHHIANFYSQHKVPWHEQFDYIFVNNKYMVLNSRPNSYCKYGDKLGMFYVESKESTLAIMLIQLNKMIRSQPLISPDVLDFYLDYEGLNFDVFENIDANRIMNGY